MKEKYRVTFDSLEGDQFVVHKGDSSDQVFTESRCGLYYTDLNEKGFLFNKNEGIGNNNYKYSSHEFSKAALARKIQRKTKDFIHLEEKILLANGLMVQ